MTGEEEGRGVGRGRQTEEGLVAQGQGSPELPGWHPLVCPSRPGGSASDGVGTGEGGRRLGALPEGLSLVRVLQQQVHSLRQVVHIPISLYFRVVLVTGPAESRTVG